MSAAPLWAPVAVASAAALSIGAIGGLLTDVGPWYQALKQPAWKPPDVAFGPIWTTIFALSATAGVIGWRRAANRAQRRGLIARFAANAGLNMLWSLLYFKLRRPDWALIEVPFLWLSVLSLVVFFAHFAKTAAFLMLPYLVWVSIATVLNWKGVELNAPFAGR